MLCVNSRFTTIVSFEFSLILDRNRNLYIVIQLEALDKRVDDLEKDEIRDAIKGVRDDISSLRRAN